MKTITLFLLTLLIFSSCSRWDKPDVREAKWGMTKEQVKKVEDTELVKEGENILTYRLDSTTNPIEVEEIDMTEYEVDEDQEITKPEVESISREYDLLYVFGEDGLGMVVIHLRESLDNPDDYLELFKVTTNSLTQEIGEPAKGIASYEDHKVKANPYENPAAICRGEHGLQHIWPTKDKKTNVSLELDSKKFAADPSCTISIFYESVEIPVDQELSDQLRELL